MATYLYRKSSGEVLGMSVDSSAYAGIDPDYYAHITDPTISDDASLVPKKVYKVNVLRNATQQEIDTFSTFAASDENLLERKRAKILLETKEMKKVLKSLVEVIIGEINVLRSQHSLSGRTLEQAVTAIKNKIDDGSND